MSEFSLSKVIVSQEGDQLDTLEYVASVTTTSTLIIERLVELGLIEPVGSMLRQSDITRITQIQRLRQDLGLNLVGAAMVLDMAQEIAQLKARLQVCQG